MKQIVSKIIFCLIILGIIAMTIWVIAVCAEDYNDPRFIPSPFPGWLLKLLSIIILGAYIYIPTGILGIAYYLLNKKGKNEP